MGTLIFLDTKAGLIYFLSLSLSLSLCVCVCVCVWRGIQNLEFQYRFGVFIKNNYFRGMEIFMVNIGGHF